MKTLLKLACIVCLGCGWLRGADALAYAETKRLDSFEVTFSIPSTSGLIGKPFVIELRVKNVSEVDQKLGYLERFLQATKVQVFNLSKSDKVPLTLLGRNEQDSISQRYLEKNLAPGESVTLRIPMLQQLFDLTLPARYRIEVSWLPQTARIAPTIEEYQAMKANPPKALTFAAEFMMNPGPW